MLLSKKNVGANHMNCGYGCCPSYPKKMQKRLVKRRENRAWKKDYN